MDLSIEMIARNFFDGVPSYERASFSGAGWTLTPSSMPEFVEPPLKINEGGDFTASKIWLISAPGAVGKSTFAKQLALRTKALYIDLAKAETIGSNYLTGGLFKSGLAEFIGANKIAVLIDAIDEASLRVTFESRIDFYKDVVALAKDNKFPILIFGRQASIDEASLILEYCEVRPIRITIDYFERSEAIRLVKNMIKQKIKNHKEDYRLQQVEQHEGVVENAIRSTLDSLDMAATTSNKNFSGYAPVLDAVAEYIYPESNFSRIENESHNICKGPFLESICYYILKREQNKFLNQFGFEGESQFDLYSVKEQMNALCCIYAGHMIKDIKFESHGLSEDKKQSYIKMAKEFIEQHPFLVDGKQPTNIVFAGALQSFALKQKIDCCLEIFHKYAVSPLLAEFYFQNHVNEECNTVATEHIPLLISSYEALSGENTTICLDISGDESSDFAEVSIICRINDEEKNLQSFKTKANGKLTFGRQVCSLDIDCPLMDIEFQDNSLISFNLPVNIDARKIFFKCQTLQFIGEGMVTMTAKECCSEVLDLKFFGSIDLYVGWPGSSEYPWTKAKEVEILKEHNQDKLQTALFSFCKLIRAFRSHSKGKLARFEDKIDHNRMSKNYGEEIKQYLLNEGVITHSVEKRMYYLDSNKLAEIGFSYQDVTKKNCPEKLLKILKDIIN